jgi:ribonuclease HII
LGQSRLKRPHYRHELKWQAQGHALVAGVDEVGRGPLAGPVYAAAVILDPKLLGRLKGVDDSKKLDAVRREHFFDRIQECSLDWAVGSCDEREVDRLNILQASLLAMRRALDGLKLKPTLVLVDGNQETGGPIPSVPLVGGDAISLSIASASILAKVSRDLAMQEYHRRFPDYGFDRHKGYGTSFHLKALASLGPCEAHRKTFLSNVLEQKVDES